MGTVFSEIGGGDIRKGHVPERTCVGCGRKAAKGEFIRLARNAEGSVAIDTKFVLPGRGAYVCARSKCLRAARKKMAKALRCDPGAVAAVWPDLEALVGSRLSG